MTHPHRATQGIMQHHDKILGTLSFTSVHKEELVICVSSPVMVPKPGTQNEPGKAIHFTNCGWSQVRSQGHNFRCNFVC